MVTDFNTNHLFMGKRFQKSEDQNVGEYFFKEISEGNEEMRIVRTRQNLAVSVRTRNGTSVGHVNSHKKHVLSLLSEHCSRTALVAKCFVY